MTSRAADLKDFAGSYEGAGAWVDIAGESMRYRILQKIEVGKTALRVEYEHNFFEEGKTTNGEFVLERLSETLLRVRMGGAHVGHGYVFGHFLHFHVHPAEAYVQVSYRLSEGKMLVAGSSTKNAQGRYIAWNETLQRRET